MADDLRYFRPRNWAKFQHYKDRRPPWIKLHRSLLHDHDFHQLTIPQQRHLMFLWLLYAESAAPLPLDNRWLARNLQVDYRTVAGLMSILISSNFIELCDKSASTALASRKHNASLETETEKETEKERESRPRPRERSPADSSRGTRCPDVELDDEWAKAANQKREKSELPLLSRAQLRHRWEDFRTYWAGVPGSRGLKKDWRATWLNNCVSPKAEAKFRPHEVKESGGQVTSSRFMT